MKPLSIETQRELVEKGCEFLDAVARYVAAYGYLVTPTFGAYRDKFETALAKARAEMGGDGE